MPGRLHVRYPAPRIVRSIHKRYRDLAWLLGFQFIVVRRQGAFFLVDPRQWVDYQIAIDGGWEADLVNRLAAICEQRHFDHFIDVGANIGYYSILFAVHRLADQIIAFEPSPSLFEQFHRSLALNRLTKSVIALPVALGDSATEITLTDGPEGNPAQTGIYSEDIFAGRPRYRAKQVRFDDEFAIRGKTILLKMDIEGYEIHALSGMARTLRENACYIQVEAFPHNVERVSDYLRGLGYRRLGTMNHDHFFTNIPGIE